MRGTHGDGAVSRLHAIQGPDVAHGPVGLLIARLKMQSRALGSSRVPTGSILTSNTRGHAHILRWPPDDDGNFVDPISFSVDIPVYSDKLLLTIAAPDSQNYMAKTKSTRSLFPSIETTVETKTTTAAEEPFPNAIAPLGELVEPDGDTRSEEERGTRCPGGQEERDHLAPWNRS